MIAVLLLQSLLVFVMFLTSGLCRLKPLRTTRPIILRRDVEPKLPPGFRVQDIPNLRVPSRQFCEQQQLQPSARYLVLPWWYQYCVELRARREPPRAAPHLRLYREVLNLVNRVKGRS